MKLLFWNLNKHALEDYVTECAREQHADVICLAEPRGLNLNRLLNQLGEHYRCINPEPLTDKVCVLINDTVSELSKISVGNRYLVCTLNHDNIIYNLAVVHLQDQRNDARGSARTDSLSEIVAKLEERETQIDGINRIIIGDFNTDPFSEELISPSTLFATLFKDEIESHPTRQRNGKQRALMYNPVISYISDEKKQYGSYYYEKEFAPLFWHFYDQIVVSHSLINSISVYEYLKSIGSTPLIKAGRPNKYISDHLPLFVILDNKKG